MLKGKKQIKKILLNQQWWTRKTDIVIANKLTWKILAMMGLLWQTLFVYIDLLGWTFLVQASLPEQI